MKIKLVLRFAIIITFLFTTIGFAQDIIKVEIQDGNTSEPLSFATIRFKDTNRGIVADYDGQFRLPFQLISDLPMLVITYLGYIDVEVDSKTLSKTEVNKILLFPQTEALDEVIVNTTTKGRKPTSTASSLIKKGRKMLASDIVKKAVNAIPINLDKKPHSYIGYYRDYQLVDNVYNNLNEGIIEQFDSGINSLKVTDSLNQSVLYSFKRNPDFETNDKYTVAYNGETKFIQNAKIDAFGGNELTLLNVHNTIRNYDVNSYSYVYRMTKEFLQNHNFVQGEIIFNGDEPVMEVDLEKINKNVGVSSNVQDQIFSVQGKLLISLKDYAIHSFSYLVYDRNKLNPLFNIKTEYRRQDEKMYLNYISFNNRFVITNNDMFKELLVSYNKKSNSFNVVFNNKLDLKTVQKRDFKIRFKGRKIYIKNIEITGGRSVKLKIAAFDKELKLITQDDMSSLELKIKNITDIENREIYETRQKIGYQFREYFIQEVFTDKKLNKNYEYMPKTLPLGDAPINRNADTDNYIINSPLMQRRMKINN